jgi:predicted KAP-like P-loop ATPase
MTNITDKILAEFDDKFPQEASYTGQARITWGFKRELNIIPHEIKEFIKSAIRQTAESVPSFDVGAGVLDLKDGEKCSVSKHNDYNEHVDLIRDWKKQILEDTK